MRIFTYKLELKETLFTRKYTSNHRKILYLIATLAILVSIATIFTLKQTKFGKAPSGKRLERIQKSPNYKNGAFQNQHYTPILAEGSNFFKIAKERIFGKKTKGISPIHQIPSVKTDLLHLDKSKDILVWFGHSSYFMQIDGKTVLVDPVLSGSVSPFSFILKAFKGTDPYTTDDLPEIDYLFISHDHWDHLDYETVLALKSKTRKVVCGLGVGAHLEHWGYSNDNILEMDWNEQAIMDEGFTVYSFPTRHFSGRGLKRNQTLWLSFVFQTSSMKIFISGDGGYDTHFAKIGESLGPIDLAILENGQYDENWKHIHLLPDEIIKVYKDLKAKQLLSVHSSKFVLANHPWDEPLSNISAWSEKLGIHLITPMIGERVDLKDSTQVFSKWWEHPSLK